MSQAFHPEYNRRTQTAIFTSRDETIVETVPSELTELQRVLWVLGRSHLLRHRNTEVSEAFVRRTAAA